ncbi:MAG: hypothetical protein LBV12_05850, partial [Puniceicoccales bacterium]|nr:hypothetical protein [Puniceicoccales bacterium]
MNTQHNPEAMPSPAPDVPPNAVRRRFTWASFGGDGFLASLLFHSALVAVALFWVVKSFVTPSPPPPPPPERVELGGGSNPGAFKNTPTTKLPPVSPISNKIVVKGPGSVTLPEMPSVNIMGFNDSLMGSGNGGLGSGNFPSTGEGSGPGDKKGYTGMINIGSITRRPNSIEGTLYDTKRDRSGKDLFDPGNQQDRIAEMEKSIRGFVRNGAKKEWLDSKYATAPDRLYATSVFISPIDASSAMKPFGAENDIRAPGWLLYYEGWITPPVTDEYRFCGMGDDALLMLIDGKPVLWAPWSQGNMGTWFRGKDWQPEAAYKAGGTLPSLGNGGRYFGSWVPMQKGRSYKLQVLLG